MSWWAMCALARHDMRLLLRQREVLVWVFLMPIVFIVFFGTMSSVVHPRRSGELRFAIEGDADGPLARRLVQRLRAVGAEVDEIGEGGAVGPRRVLTLPDGFEARMMAGDSLAIDLSLPADGLTASQDLFVARAAFGLLALDVAAAESRAALIDAHSFESEERSDGPLRLDITPVGPSRPTPFGIRQTVPGLLMTLVLVNILTSGAVLLVGERREGLLVRLVSAPVSRMAIVLGKSASRFALAVTSLMVGLAGARLLFREEFATWIASGTELLAVGTVLVAFAAVCAAGGILLGNLARTEAQAITIGVVSSNAFAALGGCWFPIGLAPPWMFSLSRFLPTGWAMDAVQRATSARADETRGVFDAVWGAEVAGLVLLTGVFLLLASRSFRFR